METRRASGLEARIQREGEVISSEFLRVSGFLNHRIDPTFVTEAGGELARAFWGCGVTCVLTAEAAGNVIAYEVARRLGASALYAKKGHAATMCDPLVRAVRSPTKGNPIELTIAREYLGPKDRVLVVDDFLYQGTTSAALADMVLEAGAQLVGFGFVIEKCFGEGRKILTKFGVPIASLVKIVRMDPKTREITFGEA